MIAAGSGAKNSTWANAAFRAALSVGFTAFDTAHEYGNQEGVGLALATVPRSQFFLTTKVPGCLVDPSTLDPFKCGAETQRVLDRNLQQLNMSYVDLLLVHYPPLPAFVVRGCNNLTGSCEMLRAQWAAVEAFYAAGKARAIGVSNFCPSCFECLSEASVKPMVNQLQYHVGMGVDPAGAMTTCIEHGCVVQGYGALGNPPLDPRDPGPSPEILHGNLTTTIAKAHDVSTVQVALKWIVQHGVPCVTKSSNPQHLKEDLDLWTFNLTAAEMAQLDAHTKPSGTPSFACSK